MENLDKDKKGKEEKGKDAIITRLSQSTYKWSNGHIAKDPKHTRCYNHTSSNRSTLLKLILI